MYEKISEIPIRQEKVRKLKEKILKEIDKYLKMNREELEFYLTRNETNAEDWNYMITEEFSLLRLKEYIENDRTFMSIIDRHDDKDIIIYAVPDRELNVWLQDDYSFTSNFLCKIQYEGCCDVYTMLNDRFFRSQFTNIFDKIFYDEKIKRKEEI